MIVAMTLALLAASAPTDQASQAAVPAPAAKSVKEKKICRNDEATTGSLMRSKTCHTKAEWDALAGRSSSGTPDRQSPESTSEGR